MPEISRFYGMVIKMYFIQADHNPPHIHAIYGDYMGAIDIKSAEMLEGDLPAKALSMVQEWIGLHRDDLLAMWNTQAFRKLPPLV